MNIVFIFGKFKKKKFITENKITNFSVSGYFIANRIFKVIGECIQPIISNLNDCDENHGTVLICKFFNRHWFSIRFMNKKCDHECIVTFFS